jgi:phosphonate transport system substrate-binding protein
MKQSDFRVIFKSEPIPGSPFVIRTNLPVELQARLKKALLKIKNVCFGKLGIIVSMDPATDEDYNIVRQLVPLKRRLKQKKRNCFYHT